MNVMIYSVVRPDGNCANKGFFPFSWKPPAED